MLDNLQNIIIQKPVDIVIGQLRSLISSGEIKPGDKLPSERVLADYLGVGRSHIREALYKLEFYGILKTYPQSGTTVSGIGIAALEELISNVLNPEDHDFKSLVETRVLLEKQAAYLAAIRRTTVDISSITNALRAYEVKVTVGKQAVEEDLLFHIKIAEASKNNVLKSLMMIITPDIVKNYISVKICDEMNFNKTLREHQLILDSIVNQNPVEASSAMSLHLRDVSNYCKM